MKTTLLLIQLISAVCIFGNTAHASTNHLWLLKVDNTFMSGVKNITLQEVCNHIEAESLRLDENERGVRIVFNLPKDNHIVALHDKLLKGVTDSSCGFVGMSLIEILSMITGWTGLLNIFIVDDVAIIGFRNIRALPLGIYGRCYDATTKKTIYDFRIESTPWKGIVKISSDGTYYCILPCLLEVVVNNDAILPGMHMFETTKEIRVVAPGYNEKTIMLDVFLPGKDGNQMVNIPLQPLCQHPDEYTRVRRFRSDPKNGDFNKTQELESDYVGGTEDHNGRGSLPHFTNDLQ